IGIIRPLEASFGRAIHATRKIGTDRATRDRHDRDAYSMTLSAPIGVLRSSARIRSTGRVMKFSSLPVGFARYFSLRAALSMVRSPPRIGLFRSFIVMSSFVLWYVDVSTHHSRATITTCQCYEQTNPTLLGKNDERGGHRNTKTPATNHDLPNLRARNHRLPHTLIGGVLLNHRGDLDTIDNILGRRCLPDEHVALGVRNLPHLH